MKVLVVGGGGREHALAWKLAASPYVAEVLVAPGNAGTAKEPGVRNVDVSADAVEALAELVRREDVDLTVVGPEVPLAKGIVDYFSLQGLKIFGPTANAAQLESSKAYSKRFMRRHGIPTADYAEFTESVSALAYIDARGAPIVVKADGLAAGKGVVVAQSIDEAKDAVRAMLAERSFGEAGGRVVIEEFLRGEEASFICVADGEHVIALASSQDHKARDDGDHGPNTGGMGAYSPAPVVTDEMHHIIMRDIIHPTVEGMAKDGIPFIGFLYAGVMIDESGKPKVLEFNCRLGDPEAQVLLARMKSDLAALFLAALDKQLYAFKLEWDERMALGVVMAAKGYPGEYEKGAVIEGILEAEQRGAKVFHAGTRLQDETVLTAGGRVLCVVGLGAAVSHAQRRAYEGVRAITFDGAFFRSDIGWRAAGKRRSP